MTIIIGNISKAAETRQVSVGGVPTLVTDFNLAENYRKANGDQATQYYRVSLWRDKGTKLAQYLTKGRPIAVEGRVGAQAYLDKDEKPQATLTISNPRITFITKNPDGKVEGEPDVEELPFPVEE